MGMGHILMFAEPKRTTAIDLDLLPNHFHGGVIAFVCFLLWSVIIIGDNNHIIIHIPMSVTEMVFSDSLLSIRISNSFGQLSWYSFDVGFCSFGFLQKIKERKQEREGSLNQIDA
jgi:hypothetical protein